MNTQAQQSADFRNDAKIRWHRSHVDPDVMAELLRRSDTRGWLQAGGHLGLWIATGMFTYFAFRQISPDTWAWAAPLLLLGLFAHGTVGSFLGGAACHELGHRTVFRTRALSEIFLRIYAFFGWWDHVWFRTSHIKHHQVTIHSDYDGEVVLPQHIQSGDWKFWLSLFAWNPVGTWTASRNYFSRALGKMDNAWYEFVLPEENERLRRRHRNWAGCHLVGHAALATLFILTGHWFLIIIFNFGSHYCGWLTFLCGHPQHYGMQGDVPDHRLCTRTYITSGLPAFLYWNMQYHVEHHMFPAVPFFRLGELRKAIEHDLPPAPRGLVATWKEILAVHRTMRDDPDYFLVPELPVSNDASYALDPVLEREAAGTRGSGV